MWNEGEIERLVRNRETGEFAVSVFRRRLKRGSVYYARYKVERRELANGQRYLTESLRTHDRDVALERARERYAALKTKQASGGTIKALTVDQAIDKFLAHYKAQLAAGVNRYTPAMLATYQKTVDTYWRAYVGTSELNSISIHDLEDYEAWRRDFARKRSRTNRRYKSAIAERTVQWEINSFKAMLRWCSMRSWYTGRAQEWSFKLTAHNRRSAFSLDEYKALVRYMRTAQFLRKGKHGSDRRLMRHRMMLRTYILFMANTGLRVGEARHLKWQDIEERTNKGGRKVVVVRVSRLRGKRRQERNAVGRDTALLALNRWREYLRGQGEPCRGADYIFCDEKGRAIHDMREGFNSIIREAGVELDKDGNKYTIYCLRHFYITSRLKFGKNVSAHKIAKNCGTSIAMIDKYYSHVIADDFIDDLSI